MPPADSRGFTLLEVIVVLAILGLLGALVLSRGPQRSATLELRAAVSATAGTLRLARTRAIAANRPVPVLLGPAGAAIPGLPRRPFPAGVALALTVPRGQPPDRITFLPDGSATGGTVALRTATGTADLAVDWLSGNVSIRDARRAPP